jgi:hypothetical protein
MFLAYPKHYDRTNASTAARVASGSVGHARTTIARSGSMGVELALFAYKSATPAPAGLLYPLVLQSFAGFGSNPVGVTRKWYYVAPDA